MHVKDEITLNLKLQHEKKILRKFEKENPGKMQQVIAKLKREDNSPYMSPIRNIKSLDSS